MRKEHSPEAIRIRLGSQRRPSLVRDAILGGTDGCVTTFAVVSGAIGGGLEGRVVIILGFANLIADGFSMAASNYLGAESVNEELERARAEELRHIETVPEGEAEEVRQIFSAKGFQGDILDKIVSVITGNKRIWVDTMVTEELGLQQGNALPVRAAMATFTAFCIAGLIPLAPFLFPGVTAMGRFGSSCAATAAAFYLIGYLKGKALRRSAWKSGLGTLALGGTAAALAYGMGVLLGSIGGH